MSAYLVDEVILRQVLGSISGQPAEVSIQEWIDTNVKLIETLRTILSNPPKEPVAWHGVTGDYGYSFLSFHKQPGMTPLYTKDS